MTQFLITNARTNESTWIEAPSKKAALFLHEQARRKAAGEAALPKTAKASHDHLRMSLGDSHCTGLPENVERA